MQLEGGGCPQCKGQHEESPVEGTQVEVPGTEQGSGSPRGQKGRGDGGRQGQVAGGSVCPGERPRSLTSQAGLELMLGTSMPPAGIAGAFVCA